MNSVLLTGHLCKDIDLRKTQNGTSVASGTIGVKRDFKEDDEYKTDFIDLVLWNTQAEYLYKYGHKGDLIEVLGRLQIRFYENQSGTKVKVTEVVVEKVKVLKKQEEQKEEPTPSNNEIPNDDDLPF